MAQKDKKLNQAKAAAEKKKKDHYLSEKAKKVEKAAPKTVEKAPKVVKEIVKKE